MSNRMINYFSRHPEQQEAAWKSMEEAQEKYPHYWFGWDGFMLMVVYV